MQNKSSNKNKPFNSLRNKLFDSDKSNSKDSLTDPSKISKLSNNNVSSLLNSNNHLHEDMKTPYFMMNGLEHNIKEEKDSLSNEGNIKPFTPFIISGPEGISNKETPRFPINNERNVNDKMEPVIKDSEDIVVISKELLKSLIDESDTKQYSTNHIKDCRSPIRMHESYKEDNVIKSKVYLREDKKDLFINSKPLIESSSNEYTPQPICKNSLNSNELSLKPGRLPSYDNKSSQESYESSSSHIHPHNIPIDDLPIIRSQREKKRD